MQNHTNYELLIFEEMRDGCDMLGFDLFDVCCICAYMCDVWVNKNWNKKVVCDFVFHKYI